MALKRFTWPVTTLVALALVAVAALPPRPFPSADRAYAIVAGGRFVWLGPEGRVYRRTLTITRTALRDRLESRHRADSIVRLSRGPLAVHSADGAVTVVREASLSSDSARFWLRAVAAELSAYPSVPGGSPVPVILALHATRQDPMVRQAVTARMLADAGGRRACIVAVNITKSIYHLSVLHRESGSVETRVLDLCALYARFGVPGQGAGDWVGPVRSPVSWSSQADLAILLYRARRSRTEPQELSISAPWYYLLSLPSSQYTALAELISADVLGCVRGSGRLCLAEFGLREGVPLRLSVEWRRYWGWRLLDQREFLADLLVRGSPEQFARFWRSPLPAAAALEAGYGKPAGDLLVEWAQRRYRAPSGTRLRARSASATVGWLLVALAGGIAVAKRREAGA